MLLDMEARKDQDKLEAATNDLWQAVAIYLTKATKEASVKKVSQECLIATCIRTRTWKFLVAYLLGTILVSTNFNHLCNFLKKKLYFLWRELSNLAQSSVSVCYSLVLFSLSNINARGPSWGDLSFILSFCFNQYTPHPHEELTTHDVIAKPNSDNSVWHDALIWCCGWHSEFCNLPKGNILQNVRKYTEQTTKI